MPFDGVGFPPSVALAKIDRVMELLATEDRWCKGIVRSPGGQLCIVGALIEAEARALLEPALRAAVREVTGRTPTRLERFNDAPATTHGLVLAVLRQARADILAGRRPPQPLPRRLELVCERVLGRLRLW